jgi:hypothetical protein
MVRMTCDEQQRGDRSAYERYLRGMDSSMKQKVALTAAHLLAVGRVADMGSAPAVTRWRHCIRRWRSPASTSIR